MVSHTIVLTYDGLLTRSSSRRSRRAIRKNFDATVNVHTRVGKTFTLLIETGIIYTFSCVCILQHDLVKIKLTSKQFVGHRACVYDHTSKSRNVG